MPRPPLHRPLAAPLHRPLAALLLLAGAPFAAHADAALAKSRNCIACHKSETQAVGPGYRDIAKRYAGQPDAAARLAKSIRSGSKGQWPPAKGPALPMPPNPTVKPEEAERLARWILTGAR